MNKFFILFFSIICFVFFLSQDYTVFSNRVFLTSIIIQIISLIKIFSHKNIYYSLNKTVFLFSFFFFGIAPLVQFSQFESFFGSRSLTELEYYYMNLLVIFIIIAYDSIYKLFFRFINNEKLYSSNINFQISTVSIKQTGILIFISLVSFLSVLYINNFNLLSFLLRDSEFKTLEDTSSYVYLIIYYFLQPLSMIVFLYYSISPQKIYFVSIVLFLLAFITCFPLGMARFAAAAMYIPLLLVTIKSLKKENIFSLAFVFGILFVFPFLDIFRGIGNSKEIVFKPNFDMFLSANYDSYQNFALIVSENLITWGRQLLGVFLFWIPRFLWPSKPIGSGALLANKLNFYFDNISANYFAEGYINFGFLGIIMFIIILAFITAKYDKIYWNNVFFQNNNFFKVKYYILIGMTFFLLRGDLLSGFSFTLGFLSAFYFVFRIINNIFIRN